MELFWTKLTQAIRRIVAKHDRNVALELTRCLPLSIYSQADRRHANSPLLWLIAHLNYFFWCRSNISVLLRGGNRNNQTGRKITSRPTVIWLISWILKTIYGMKNWSDLAWQDSFGQTLAWVSLSYHKTSLHCKAVRLFTWAKEFLATSDRGVTQDVSEPGGGWGGC